MELEKQEGRQGRESDGELMSRGAVFLMKWDWLGYFVGEVEGQTTREGKRESRLLKFSMPQALKAASLSATEQSWASRPKSHTMQGPYFQQLRNTTVSLRFSTNLVLYM